tara:strand:+ start:389 stop:595 length:207 start_codon:yes stop_codon:yes gene_type:complete
MTSESQILYKSVSPRHGKEIFLDLYQSCNAMEKFNIYECFVLVKAQDNFSIDSNTVWRSSWLKAERSL